MNSYLVDYENVVPGGLDGIDTLNMKLNQSKSKIFYHKVDTSHKNALDFQLSSYLGWLVHENPEHNYFVVSKDTGFNALLPLWKKLRANVSIVADLTKKNVQENNNNMAAQVLELTKDSKNASAIAKIILSYKTKQGINNALVKTFESKKAGEIYKAIKPLLADKKGR